MFPYFFDKSPSSNFYKSQSVTNNQFKNLYQALFNVKESFHLEKRCLIWKEQNVPYDYVINFVANYPHLKSVKCYKNDTLIYMEEYSEQDNPHLVNTPPLFIKNLYSGDVVWAVTLPPATYSSLHLHSG